jgi:hypothetical protein
VANAVLLKLILLLTGALYLPEELAQEIDGVLVPQRLPSVKKYTAATRNSPAIGKRKNVPFPPFLASHVACRELLDLRLCKREGIKR